MSICNYLQIDPNAPWNEISTAFEQVEAWPLLQGWREETEPGFRPANVKLAWDGEGLLVLAILKDDDIFNPVHTFNQACYDCGDVFELFLRPENQEAYYEFHVNPNNAQFQLRIPSAKAFASVSAVDLEDWLQSPALFESRVEVDAAAQTWRVFARIPLAALSEEAPVQPGQRWGCSFSRYDYSREDNAPVLSSTSAHRKISFHRQAEWRTLELG